MQQNEMKKQLEGYKTKNDVSRSVYNNMIIQPENEKKNKVEDTNDNNSTNEYVDTSKKKHQLKRINTKKNKQLNANNSNIEYNEEVSDEWNNIDFSKYLNQKQTHNKKKRGNNLKKIHLDKSEYPKMWLGKRIDNSVLDN